ncbi:MAG: response regulator transcription factor [Crocinitomicaceae bacterium]|nr:response regulator transcription factor [Crocinitomicaceae bacterium]
MKRPITVGIAEDHELVRQGFVSLLGYEEDIKVVFDVGDGVQLLKQIKKHRVDIVLLDLEMPILNGHQALKILTERYSDIRVIIISMHYTDHFITDCITNGARGFLAKNCDIERVVDAMFAVQEQGYYFDDKISRALLQKLIEKETIQPTFSPDPLTSREVQIIQMMCEEKMNKEISELLCISTRTVEAHRKSIAEKTNSKNIAGVVIYAIKNGLYKLEG